MKHYLLAILLFNFISLPCFSQNNDNERILSIKSMYKDVTLLEKSIDSAKQCKTGKKINYDSFGNSDSEKYPFEQLASKCSFKNGYTTLTGNFSGYEWGDKTIFYYNENDLFFVFTEGGAESCYSEYRIYYNTKGTPIKILEKSNDCNGEHPTNNVEIMDKNEQKRIIDKINKDHTDILEMLK
jgi:hypothetical protein